MKKVFCFLTTFLMAATFAFEEGANIPILDMNEYYSEETRDDFVKQLSNGFHELGFVAIINSGLDQEIIDRAYESVEEFFNLDLETKQKYDGLNSNFQRGYIPHFQEKAKGEKLGDFKEFYHIGRILTEEQQERLGFFINVWPEEVSLQENMIPFYKQLEAYMIPLHNAIEEALGFQRDYLNEMTLEGDCLLRVIHYPKNSPPDSIWAAAHTDIDLLAILPRATCDGLEVQLNDGTWLRVDAPKDALIINAGDMLENLSNGYFKSAPHRVTAPTDRPEAERYSTVLFIHPRKDDDLTPHQHCIERTGGVKKYANVTRWELLMERLADLDLANDEMLEELAASGTMERLIEVGRASPDALLRIRDHGYANEKILKYIDELGL